MFDKEGTGKIQKDRIIDIMADISDEKVDVQVIETLMEEMALNKETKQEEDEFEIDFTNFLRIVVLYLKSNIEEDEHRNAF